MDEAFLPFSEILKKILSFNADLTDEQGNIHFYIHECEIETPVELDVTVDEQGALYIGSVPPLYYVDTTIRPSYHRLTFKAELEAQHGEQ